MEEMDILVEEGPSTNGVVANFLTGDVVEEAPPAAEALQHLTTPDFTTATHL